MELLLPIIFVILLVLIILVGLERAIQILPVLVIFGLLLYFFGWFVVNFFWLILLFWFIRKLANPKVTRTRGNNTSYRTYTNKEAEEFFREYFRQQGYSQNSSSSYGNSNYRRQGEYNTWGENRDEYYKVLGVERNCTKEELRKAYLKKVKENHPDRFSNASQQEKTYHEEKLKKINEAYDNLLKDFS